MRSSSSLLLSFSLSEIVPQTGSGSGGQHFGKVGKLLVFPVDFPSRFAHGGGVFFFVLIFHFWCKSVLVLVLLLEGNLLRSSVIAASRWSVSWGKYVQES